MSNKYNKFSKTKIMSERDQLKACLDYILDTFDRMEKQIDNFEKESTSRTELVKDGWKKLAKK